MCAILSYLLYSTDRPYRFLQLLPTRTRLFHFWKHTYCKKDHSTHEYRMLLSFSPSTQILVYTSQQQPGSPLFQRYKRCNWEIEGAPEDEEDGAFTLSIFNTIILNSVLQIHHLASDFTTASKRSAIFSVPKNHPLQCISTEQTTKMGSNYPVP